MEQNVKSECTLWAKGAYDDEAKRSRALKDMSDHFLVVVFLPFQAGEIRQKVKYWGDKNGYMTQCIVSIPNCSEGRRRSITTASKGVQIQVQRSVFQ